MWFSTVQGVAILDPAAVGPPATPPSARLERVAINGTPVPPGPGVRVHRDRGEMEFHFAAVSLRDPQRVRFRHRLAGFDSDWIEVGGSRSTRYTNLPAGTYEFAVAAALDRGPWGAPARLELTLTPRFWETRQALALLGTLGLALLVLFYTARVRRERALARAVAERTKDLAEAKGRLEEWNRRQSRFVSGVSHELRTPLTLIRFYTELLVDEPEEPPEEKERAYRILVREGERLNRVIERVMQFTRIENRREEYHLEAGSLADVIRQTVDSFSGYLESAGFQVDVHLDPRAEAAPVQLDADAVAAALANLLENAIKYSRAERWVGIRLRVMMDGAAIEVEDRGIGIRPEDIERIFERYYRSTDNGRAGGYGIGLFIVREIMVAHGGRVEVESSPGSGSVFRLVFPGATAAFPSADRVAVKTGGE
jgi:signal transduction histidine kinase